MMRVSAPPRLLASFAAALCCVCVGCGASPQLGSLLRRGARSSLNPAPAYSQKQSYGGTTQFVFDPWSEWTPCSCTCGAGTQFRERACRVGLCSGPIKEQKVCSHGPCPNWGKWTQWTDCSTTCGPGYRTRRRFCSTYYGCEGPASQKEDCNQGSCAIWSPWSVWGKCSAFCDTGEQKRTRTCSIPGQCAGDASETQQCSKNPCCSEWSSWSACSVTCGVAGRDGVETRNRRCMIELQTYTGGYASETQTEERPCTDTIPPCSQWSPWGKWSPCDKTCGGGEKTRLRTCTPESVGCDGAADEAVRCNQDPCPGWNVWGSWSACSVTCGGGERARQRQCDVAGKCSGENKETEPCSPDACPSWSSWGPWSHCSESCGGGWQKRTRVCDAGEGLCNGDAFEKRLCNEHLCPDIGEWQAWTQCDQPCDGGTRSRTRPCLTDNVFCAAGGQNADAGACQCSAASEEGEPCNAHYCARWEDWAAWSQCTEACGGGERQRARQCDSDESFCVGDNKDDVSCVCTGDATQIETCNSHNCPEWSPWAAWAQCSASCGGGSMQRTRTCDTDGAHCTPAKARLDPTCRCVGLDEGTDICNKHLCPTWSPWAAWGACTAPCGGGEKARSRDCLVDDDYCSGKPGDAACTCLGDGGETTTCNEHQCAGWEAWTAWGKCSADCGGGTQTRRRLCQTDAAVCFGDAISTNADSCQCQGDGDEANACNTHKCAQWTQWGQWQSCSVTCGGGMQQRERTCSNDQSYCVGDKLDSAACQCAGSDTDEKPCGTYACPAWKQWAAWGTCSVTCSDGEQVRTRQCKVDTQHCTGANANNAECKCEDGEGSAVKKCTAGPCYQWESWQSWSDCSVVCGGGSRNRARQCPQADACPGLTEESSVCNQRPCPDWGSWAPWSSCSATCNGGQMVRTRTCPLIGGCTPGSDLEVEVCGPDPCPVWAQWSTWGECSATCGNGVQVRARECNGKGECRGAPEQVEECFFGPCALNIAWSGWSPCTQTCGGGVKTRSRKKCIDPSCETEYEQEPCEEQPCPEWTQWQVWTTCSKTCGGGSRERSRQCADQQGASFPLGCVGQKIEVDPKPCSDFACTNRMFFFF